MGVLYAVFSKDFSMTDTQEKIAMIMIGILSAGMGQIMNFLFGSSAGSKSKDPVPEARVPAVIASGD